MRRSVPLTVSRGNAIPARRERFEAILKFLKNKGLKMEMSGNHVFALNPINSDVVLDIVDGQNVRIDIKSRRFVEMVETSDASRTDSSPEVIIAMNLSALELILDEIFGEHPSVLLQRFCDDSGELDTDHQAKLSEIADQHQKVVRLADVMKREVRAIDEFIQQSSRRLGDLRNDLKKRVQVNIQPRK